MRRRHTICLTDCSKVRLPPQSLFFLATLTCVAFATAGGCASNDPITSWDSPRMLELEKKWDSVACITTQDKSVYEKLQHQLNRILEDNLSHNDLRQLVATCGTLPVHAKDRSRFVNAVLAYMAETLVDSGDRDNLVKLLSTRCPLRICGYEDIAFYLAIRGKRLKDPILVLGEAFSKCQVPEVRHDIAGAVRRGFGGLGIRG
jgi:hypothetical protein